MEITNSAVFRRYKAGYVVWSETWGNSGGPAVKMKAARNPSGDYIGNTKTAHRLCKKRGIAPEKRTPDSNVCSIGFCEREQKWYGWSHRALYGFGIGSQIKRGDCGYMPTDKEDFRLDCIRFWDDDGHEKVHAFEDYDEEVGVWGVRTQWEYANTIPNEKLRGTRTGVFSEYPEEFGHGEWTAETLDGARQMACDFAEGVS